MDKFTVQLDWDALQSVVVQVLKKDLDGLREDWNRRHEGGGWAVFSVDREEDLAQISAHISAYKKVIRYYGGATN